MRMKLESARHMLEDEVPFREQLMRAGEQRFGLLTPHGRIPA